MTSFDRNDAWHREIIRQLTWLTINKLSEISLSQRSRTQADRRRAVVSRISIKQVFCLLLVIACVTAITSSRHYIRFYAIRNLVATDNWFIPLDVSKRVDNGKSCAAFFVRTLVDEPNWINALNMEYELKPPLWVKVLCDKFKKFRKDVYHRTSEQKPIKNQTISMTDDWARAVALGFSMNATFWPSLFRVKSSHCQSQTNRSENCLKITFQLQAFAQPTDFQETEMYRMFVWQMTLTRSRRPKDNFKPMTESLLKAFVALQLFAVSSIFHIFRKPFFHSVPFVVRKVWIVFSMPLTHRGSRTHTHQSTDLPAGQYAHK